MGITGVCCIHHAQRYVLRNTRKIPLFAISRFTSSDTTSEATSTKQPIDLRQHTNMDLEARFGYRHIRCKLNVVSLGLLGTGGNELNPSFFVKCDTRAYIFNLVEGWTRMNTYFPYSMTKRPVSFITHASWENVCGSASFYNYQEEYNKKQLYYGPKRVDRYMKHVKLFTGQRTWERVEVQKEGEIDIFKDENITVSAVKLENPSDVNSVVAYSCKLVDMSGTFLPERALELGVRHGPAFNILLLGYSVITEKGDLVHPSDVVTSSRKGPSFLVVDCPTESYIDSIVSNQYLQPDWFRENEQEVKLIVHITPHHILQQEPYCEWMSSFGNNTDHILLHGSLCPGEVGYRTSMTLSLPLHLMNPNVYPFPRIPEGNDIDRKSLNVCKYLKEDSVFIGRLDMKYHLKPSKGVDTTNCLNPIEDRIKSDLNVLKESNTLTKRILHHRKLLSIENDSDILSFLTNRRPLPRLEEDDAMVTFLGTSASYSTRTRNVSGILVQTPEGNILLDCGEGTVKQMYTCFGTSKAKDILSKIKVVFLSHLHIDHHIGLIRLLKEIKSLLPDNPDPVKIVSVSNFHRSLKPFSEEFTFKSINAYDLLDIELICAADVTLGTVQANHIRHSFGAVVRGGRKWSIVYSGDTVPSRRIVESVHAPTLLIHEGTFDDELKEKAMEFRHSTYLDAVKVGRAMEAGFTIVTHFSTRNELLPLHNKNWTLGVTPAFDFMSVRMSDLMHQQLDSSSCRNVFSSIFRYEALYNEK